MRTFKDNAGRSWTVNINVASIKRVKSLLGVNLMDAVEGELLERLSNNPILLCDVLYALCKTDADNQNITDEQFGEGMGGDAIEFATAALLEELVDFFPQGRRQLLKKALKKLEMVEKRVIKHAETKLDDPRLEKQIEDALTSITDSALSLPVSPESNLGASP